MKKEFIILVFVFFISTMYSQEIVDISGKKIYKINGLKANEQFSYQQIGTKQGFQLNLFGKSKDGSERSLGKIANYSGYGKLCENGQFFFSIDNHLGRKSNPDLLDELFLLDIKEGVIKKLFDALAFIVSDDGRYVCYCEVYQKKQKENHDVSYWYIYETNLKKNKVIINKKQVNNWDIFIPVFDDYTKSFIFGIGYDDEIMDEIRFNPYEMKW